MHSWLQNNSGLKQCGMCSVWHTVGQLKVVEVQKSIKCFEKTTFRRTEWLLLCQLQHHIPASTGSLGTAGRLNKTTVLCSASTTSAAIVSFHSCHKQKPFQTNHQMYCSSSTCPLKAGIGTCFQSCVKRIFLGYHSFLSFSSITCEKGQMNPPGKGSSVVWPIFLSSTQSCNLTLREYTPSLCQLAWAIWNLLVPGVLEQM